MPDNRRRLGALMAEAGTERSGPTDAELMIALGALAPPPPPRSRELK